MYRLRLVYPFVQTLGGLCSPAAVKVLGGARGADVPPISPTVTSHLVYVPEGGIVGLYILFGETPYSFPPWHVLPRWAETPFSPHVQQLTLSSVLWITAVSMERGDASNGSDL